MATCTKLKLAQSDELRITYSATGQCPGEIWIESTASRIKTRHDADALNTHQYRRDSYMHRYCVEC